MFKQKISPYLRLMRIDKPVGIWLLWFPTAWALWIANQAMPSLSLFCYFFLGTVLMRSAGCVLNDMADRLIDRSVARTKNRPLATEELGLKQAFVLLFFLLVAALIILLQLPYDCIYYAVFAVFITILYPFCKRFFSAPQLVLGLAFSVSIPMAFVASGAGWNSSLLILMIINSLWVLSYDSMYAMVDREDDLKIGVRSSAILFAKKDRFCIFILQFLVHSLWFWLALHRELSLSFYMFWVIAGFILAYQQKLVHERLASDCFRAFKLNALYGLCLWLGLITAV